MRHVQGTDKIMETVAKDTHFFIDTELGYHLIVMQLVVTYRIDLYYVLNSL